MKKPLLDSENDTAAGSRRPWKDWRTDSPSGCLFSLKDGPFSPKNTASSSTTFFTTVSVVFSQSSVEGFPPWSGSWLPAGADEPIIDHHILLVVYTIQDAEALLCLRQLKWILQQEHVAAQQVVLIEQVPVHLIEAAELTP